MSASSTQAFIRFCHLLPRRVVIFLIELYRTWVSPLRLPTCRFEPTCSGYAVEALTRHGFFYGGALSVIRLLKCGPWHKPGYDPVPEESFRWPWTPQPDQDSDDRPLDDQRLDDQGLEDQQDQEFPSTHNGSADGGPTVRGRVITEDTTISVGVSAKSEG